MPSITSIVKHILLLSPLATTSQAFTVSIEQPNGVYIYDGSTNTHIPVSVPDNLTSIQPESGVIIETYKLARRGDSLISCGHTVLADYVSAKTAFLSQCNGQMLSSKSNLYAVHGDAMFFRCAYSEGTCLASDASAWFGAVDTQCGSRMTGWVKVDHGLCREYRPGATPLAETGPEDQTGLAGLAVSYGSTWSCLTVQQPQSPPLVRG
ncbi:uncharacterized protein LY89DRAFT_714779 [Mollisia scopiformis]|uniref:Uncharacterized protein n=1 Tax=Mollisia scopiformis TaxID=149040 RepID=A0A194XNI2_MOLSC|nr:uncharacterized protein LY89DRAFT_714779 [Mollisia scopiformis]KUJ21718.1 hypothetical protein LY89DRAFT_714779 [Mollisia scopiformis]